MLFQQLNRADSDKVYISIKNVEGATITTGRAVSLVNTSTDGVNAVISDAAADHRGFVGFAKNDIANNDYGLVQVSGFVDSILLSNVGSSITINAGDMLIPGPAGMFSGVPAAVTAGFRVVLASNVPVAVSAAAYASGLIPLF